MECSADAHFTFKHGCITGEINDIGGLEKYIPVCRKCFVALSQGNKPRTPSSSLTPVKVKPAEEKENLGLSDETEDSDKKSAEEVN